MPWQSLWLPSCSSESEYHKTNPAMPLPHRLPRPRLFLLLLALLGGPVVGVLARPVSQTLDWPPPSYEGAQAADALARLGDILSRPEYQWPQEQLSLLDRLLARLLDFLLQNVLAGGPNSLAAYAVTGLAAVLLFGVLLYILRTVLGNLAPAPAETEVPEDEGALTAGQAARRAEELSHGGDYRTAVRYLYLSALLALDEHGLLRYDRSRTNREYLRSVAARPEVATPLREVVDVFDAVWYGFQPLDQQRYAHYEQQVAQLRRQL